MAWMFRVLGGLGNLELGSDSSQKPITTKLTLLKGLISGLRLQLRSQL